MNRYSLIHSKLPREFVLLQGTGCRWGKCTFCDYHRDADDNPFVLNKGVLERVTGVYGVLDIINSGSCVELDGQTLAYIKDIVKEKSINTLWFEAHYMYRNKLEEFAQQFAPVTVKFRCGIESFDPVLREGWKKGVPADVTASQIAKYFKGVCLLCGTKGERREHILYDIETALQNFEYISVNLFCNNSTEHERDEAFVEWFVREVYPAIKNNPKIEVLLNNQDLGVG